MKVWHYITSFAGFVAIACLLAMLVMTNVDVFMRTFFNWPVPLVIELSGFCFAFTTFFMLAPVVRERRELKIDFIVERMNDRVRLAFRSLYDLMGIVAFSIIVWAAWGKLTWSIEVHDYIPSDPPLPTVIPWSALTLGLAMLVIALLVDLFVSLRALAGGGAAN